jgi:hypothetical protein
MIEYNDTSPQQNRPPEDEAACGPANPHPLARLKTELVWEGKYDEYGKRRPVKLPASPIPLRCTESVDAAASSAQAHRDDFRNMLIWGDNKLALAALLEQFRGQVDLIYIDPPFDVSTDFTMQVPIGDGGAAIAKKQSSLEAVATATPGAMAPTPTCI